MEHKTDLYSILTGYANKNNSPYIDPDSFVIYLEKYAKKMAEELPEWFKWTEDTGARFRSELATLAEEEKLELLHDTPNGRIYMPHFYQRLLEQYYANDDKVDSPFPNDSSLGITIPDNQVRSMGVSSELYTYMERPKATGPDIIRLNFPNEVPSALVIKSFIPQRLIESSLLKIRNYLEEYGNKEYTFSRLSSQLAGKDAIIRDMLNKIVNRPLDCFSGIAEGGEFSCTFWSLLSNLIKNDIEKKNDRLGGDIAALQSAHVIDHMNNFYKAAALKAREKEQALKMLERNFTKAPYQYTLDEIIKFTSPQGKLLLGIYSRDELAERLELLINESKDNKLPELLVFRGFKNERFYILKSKLLLLCIRLVADTREKIKSEISDHWQSLLRNYKKEPAMDNERDFDKLILVNIVKFCPLLYSILEDPKLQLVCDELEKSRELPPSCQIFNRGHDISYAELFLFKRRDLLDDARFRLPFWYSIPFIVFIIALFRGPGSSNTGKNAEGPGKEARSNEEISLDRSRDLQGTLREIEFNIVPQNHNLDSYLEELKGRWVRVIDKKAGENLVEDVNSLVRDSLRQTLRNNKYYRVTYDNLKELASNIVNNTPSLNVLNARNALRTYIEVYLVKLLENFN